MSELSDFTVRSAVHDYRVRFVDDAFKAITGPTGSEEVILMDETVQRLYGERLRDLLDARKHVVLTASEEQKSYLQLAPVINSLIERNFRKNHRLVVIGGGIVQDIGAFLAANLYRGVQWLFCPTTLLAQCDSCLGGKSSINFGKFKNQLGTFYPPHEIIIDPNLLQTLPEQDLRSGMGEMIHFFLVSGPDDFHRVKSDYDKALRDNDILRGLIYRSLQIKKRVIEIDEFDRSERLLFNYGHSFGHAIESLTNYRVPHGIAVSYGMDLANYLSMRLGYIQPDLYGQIHDLLRQNWQDVALGAIDCDNLIGALRKDKKNIGTDVVVILTQGPGRMFRTKLPIDAQVIAWMQQWLADRSR